MSPKVKKFIPDDPFATRAKPTVAPTMLCVPETGSFSMVATSSHTPAPEFIRNHIVNGITNDLMYCIAIESDMHMHRGRCSNGDIRNTFKTSQKC